MNAPVRRSGNPGLGYAYGGPALVGGILVGIGLGILLDDFAWFLIGVGAGFILTGFIAALGKWAAGHVGMSSEHSTSQGDGLHGSER